MELLNKEKKEQLKISFYGFIIMWLLGAGFADLLEATGYFGFLYWLCFVILAVWVFILSIVCLKKYEKKTFSIICLIISGFIVLNFIIGLIIGTIEGLIA